MSSAFLPASELEEARLLLSLRAGEEGAFETLVRSYGARLLAVARRYLRNEEDAREALQVAFLAAFRSIGRFEGTSQLSTWLHRILVNSCLMKLRTRRRKPEEAIGDHLPKFLEDGHRANAGGKDASFSELCMRADDFVIVAPEDNHGYPGILKYVLDTNLRQSHRE